MRARGFDFTGDRTDAGYLVAQAVARDNLVLGRTVIADCVNPIAETRSRWQATAADAGARCLTVELVCTDRRLHRARVEARRAAGGGERPDWQAVAARTWEPAPSPALRLDTARLTPDAARDALAERVRRALGRG